MGLGPDNPVNRHTLLPITFPNGLPQAGQPIPMPWAYWGDLASCSNIDGVGLHEEEILNFEIFPNPVISDLHIKFKLKDKNTL